MRSRIAALLAAFILAGAGIIGAGSSAQAAPVHSCADASVCLYQWVDFTGPSGPAYRYQIAFTTIWHTGQGCWTLTGNWPNGTVRSGNSWSFVSNPLGTYSGPDWKLRLYTTNNCTGQNAPVVMTQVVESRQLNAPYRAFTPGIKSVGLTMIV